MKNDVMAPLVLNFVREGDEHVLLELKVPARSVQLLGGVISMPPVCTEIHQ
jgi:hypothetical protein